MKYADLLQEIEDAKGHKYFDAEIFSHSGITLLSSILDDSTNLMLKNNEIYRAIEDLTNTAAEVTAQYQAYTHPAHYFAYSEMEDFMKSSASVQEKINLVFPQYAEYVTDEKAKNLPSLFVEIEKVREEAVSKTRFGMVGNKN